MADERADERAGWRAAAERALYGPGGFFIREAPAAHFRTSVHTSPLFTAAVARLLLRVDEALGRPRELALVDVGAGRGELVSGVLAALPAPVAARLRPCAVERAPRPPGLDERVEWSATVPRGLVGLLFANEWLDNVPLDVAEVGPDGVPRYVLVDHVGDESLGERLAGRDLSWSHRWWPLPSTPGARAELGWPRDLAWAAVTAGLARGVAVAVDYAHRRENRPPLGTLTGYRAGRAVRPVPDGSCDLTAHVALDACAGVSGGRLMSQRAALRALGVRGDRPALELASSNPAAYVRELARAGEGAELLDRAGLGGFSWLVCPTGPPGPWHQVLAGA